MIEWPVNTYAYNELNSEFSIQQLLPSGTFSLAPFLSCCSTHHHSKEGALFKLLTCSISSFMLGRESINMLHSIIFI